MKLGECPLCDKRMVESKNYYICKTHRIVRYKDHSKEGRPANLYKTVKTSPVQEAINYILDFKVQPEHIIFITLAATYGLFMLWIGILLTPKVIG